MRHEDVIAEIVGAHAGRLLKSRGEGDATLSVFARATDAVAAAVALQRRLRARRGPATSIFGHVSRYTPVKHSCATATTTAAP